MEKERIKVNVMKCKTDFDSCQRRGLFIQGPKDPTEEQRELCEKAVNGELVDYKTLICEPAKVGKDWEIIKDGLKVM